MGAGSILGTRIHSAVPLFHKWRMNKWIMMLPVLMMSLSLDRTFYLCSSLYVKALDEGIGCRDG